MTDAQYDFIKRAVIHAHSEHLLTVLQKAVDYQRHWLLEARALLDEIENLRLPEGYDERLREADARKRALEVMDDICSDEAA